MDGDLLDAADASINVLDHGVTVGEGAFETMRVVGGPDGRRHAFALTRHLRRLHGSLDGLGLTVPYDDATLRTAVGAVLDRNPDAGRLRLTVMGGAGPPGPARSASTPTVVVAASPQPPWPAATAVATVPWRRNEHSPLAGVKCTSYAENVIVLAAARRRGAGEAVLANTAGELCEGTSTNVFVVVGGRLLTPPLSSGCLAGVTRELVVELTGAAEETLPLDILFTAEEVFLTSSTRNVQPVSAVDDTAVPACPGAVTAAAAAAFADLAARDVDP